jgi:hypothetical protein
MVIQRSCKYCWLPKVTSLYTVHNWTDKPWTQVVLFCENKVLKICKGMKWKINRVECIMRNFSFMFLAWYETESFPSEASNGLIVPASDDGWVWKDGGMIIDIWKLSCSEIILRWCYFVHHKSHMDSSGAAWAFVVRSLSCSMAIKSFIIYIHCLVLLWS